MWGAQCGERVEHFGGGHAMCESKALSLLVQQWRLWCRGRKDNLVSCAYALCDQQVLQHEIHI